MSDEQQEYTGHVWWYREDREGTPKQFEFGRALTKREASDQIALQVGVETLPSSAVVSHRQLEKLEPKVSEAMPETRQESKEEKAKSK